MPHPPLRTTAVALAASALLALPAASQSANPQAKPSASPATQPPKTQLWLDVATHSMAGMPELGGLDGMAMGMFGGSGGGNHYGAARHAGSPGRFVDIALWNGPSPGQAAEQRVPAGLKLGPSLPLLPPKADLREDGGGYGNKPKDTQSRILVYWGCGSEVRAGQPRVITISTQDGRGQVSGSLQGRYAPDRSAKVGPSYALWPNERNRKNVPQGASLVGEHQVTGPQVPASLKFALDQSQDFMPAIALASTGTPVSGITLNWQPVTQARGYFLHAMGMQGDAMVLWSSSESPDAGMGMFDYLPEATVGKWIKERLLLAPEARSCTVPKGIFAGAGGDTDRDAGGMLQMIAYGPESSIAYPPRPADPKIAWTPEWNVRVRTKSTTFAPLGMDITAATETQPKAEEDAKPVKSLLRSLLGH